MAQGGVQPFVAGGPIYILYIYRNTNEKYLILQKKKIIFLTIITYYFML